MLGVERLVGNYSLPVMWTLTAVFSLAVRACSCLAVPVSPRPSVLLPRLTSRVMLAVRADARDVISIYLPNPAAEC